MALSRKILPTLLYFYQGELTQADADKVVEAFSDKQVHFRKVVDINDTRDLVERCAYAAGAVPMIYFIRKAPEVLTDGILADPLNRPNAAKATTKKTSDTEETNARRVRLTTNQVQPTDANVNANLLKEEIEQREQKAADPDIKSEDVEVDEQAVKASSVTGQVVVPQEKTTKKAEQKEATKATTAAPVAPVVPKA